MGFFSSKKRKKEEPPGSSSVPAHQQLPPRPSTAPHAALAHRPHPNPQPQQQKLQTSQSFPLQPSQQAHAGTQTWLCDPPNNSQNLAYSQLHVPAASGSGWTGGPTQSPPTYPPPPYNGYQRPCPPIVVNQHYYLNTQPASAPYGKKPATSLDKFSDSVINLTKDVAHDVMPQLYDESVSAWHAYGPQLVNSTVAMVDQIASGFDRVMTLIDVDKIDRNERDLFAYQPSHPLDSSRRGPDHAKSKSRRPDREYHPKAQASGVASAVVSGGYFAKVDLYANSRLPLDLPPLRLYLSTWPLLCLAANYSERVYDTPRGAEKDTHVSADWRTGTRAMVLKSVPMDDKNVIVFAIRGTANFMDWAVNLNMAPASPAGFLDDVRNLCHAGFLTSARKMIKPVAARLRQLLQENPGRSDYSLLITGHSAGGAVAALLYMHMLSTSRAAESELNILTGCFKRIHCITFGAPPVSLVPLVKPDIPQLKKSVFMSFINEGDPVARADKSYVRTLIELLASPEPMTVRTRDNHREKKSSGKSSGKTSNNNKDSCSHSKAVVSKKSHSSSRWSSRSPVWRVPNCTLSNAGRIVVLRSKEPKLKVTGRKTIDERLEDGVVAHTASDRELRRVIWGDPLCHMMAFYSRRIEALAVDAITAKGF